MTVKLNLDEFCTLVSKIKPEDVIEFATEANSDYDDPASGWYFVKNLYFYEYESRALYFDYCGGTLAFVVPLENTTDIDPSLIKPFINEYFTKVIEIGKYVYVDYETVSKYTKEG